MYQSESENEFDVCASFQLLICLHTVLVKSSNKIGFSMISSTLTNGNSFLNSISSSLKTVIRNTFTSGFMALDFFYELVTVDYRHSDIRNH
jgi:hypothetical protein